MFRFLSGGGDTSHAVCYGTFDSTYTPMKLVDTGLSSKIVAIAASPTLWVAFQDVKDSTTIWYSTSSDGEIWTQSSIFHTSDSGTVFGCAYGGGKFCMIYGSAIGFQAYTSTNGTSWTHSANLGSIPIAFSIQYLNGKFVACLSDGRLMASTDGASWDTPVTVNAGVAGFQTGGWNIAFDGTKWVCAPVMADASTKIYHSTDFSTWSSSGTYGTQSTRHQVYHNGEMFIIPGRLYPGYLGMSSTDGTTWTDCTPLGSAPVNAATSFRKWTVCVATTGATNGLASGGWGASWTGIAGFAPYPLYAVAARPDSGGTGLLDLFDLMYYPLASSPNPLTDYQRKCQIALLKECWTALTEDINAELHARRVIYAKNMINQSYVWSSQITMATLGNADIQTDPTDETAIQNTVSGLFNLYV